MSIRHQTPANIAFVGDWHGITPAARRIVQYLHTQGTTHILHTGDFGVWNTSGTQLFLKSINNLLKTNNQILYFVDGNHEEFPHLRDEKQFPLQADGTRRIRSNIFHMPRGLTWKWYVNNDENQPITFLAMGGAYSIDRKFRKLGESYWDEECINPDHVQKLVRMEIKADVLISHDSPADSPNPITDDPMSQHNAMRFYGRTHLEASNEHRRTLQTLTDSVNPAVIAHGHYHKHQIANHLREATNTRVTTISLSESTDHTLKSVYCTSLQDLYNLVQSNKAITN